MISLGLVVPFLVVVTKPDQILQNQKVDKILNFIQEHFGQAPLPPFSVVGHLVLLFTLAFSLVVVASAFIRAFLLWASAEFANRAGTDLSCEVYKRNLFQPYQAHTATNSSALISALVGKIPMIVNTLSSFLLLLTSVVLCLCITIALLLINLKIAFLSASILGIAYFCVAWASHGAIAQSARVQSEQQTQVVKALQEGLGGIRDVILDHSQAFYCSLYRSSETRLRRARAKAAILSAMPKVWVEAIALLLFAAVGGFLGFREGGLIGAIPSLGALALGAQRLLPSIQQGYSSWAYIQTARASVLDVINMLELPADLSILEETVKPLPLQDSISLKNVKFRYSPKEPWIFRDLSLSIPKGSRVGFVGKTGSGKSTCLDLLMGLLEPTGGAVYVDEQVLMKENLQGWRQNIAHVPQSIFLIDGTFAENIAFGVPSGNINMSRVREAASQSQIAKFIESSPNGYQATVGERGVRLSGGQRQRIGIARALYKQAQVLVFDEATSALDHETEKAVMEAIEGLSTNLTILIVAHRLTTLKKCTQIIDLSKQD